MFLVAVIIIFLISFIMALFSLIKESKKPEAVDYAKKELMKEKVLFMKD